jgi:5'-3' exonuclease
MGIPSYFSYILKNLKYKQDISHVNFHSLFMDCNSIIYDVYNSMQISNYSGIEEFENEIISKVTTRIDEYICFINPNKTIFIAFDGVAPFAKMEQQRNRRYRSSFVSTLLNTFDSNTNVWNTSHITPGTKFMQKLSKQISAYYFLNKNVIVSGSNDIGEGEQKIFQYIRTHNYGNNYIALYGLDADLIMLSLFHFKLTKNIYIFREEPEFKQKKQTNKTITISTPPLPIPIQSNMLFIDIELLSNSVLNEMKCKYNNKQRIYDYIFLCLFFGNDFLPHFPSLNLKTNGMQILLDNYRKHIGIHHNKYFVHFYPNQTDNSFIHWKTVKQFICELAKLEHDYLLHEYQIKNNYEINIEQKINWSNSFNSKENCEKILNDLPVVCREDEKYICPTETNWEYRYYKTLFHNCSPESSFIKDIVLNYIEGLDWVFQYYVKGCPNWKWKYNYNYPPLLCDLALYFPNYNSGFNHFTKCKRDSFSSKVQLAYVIPSSCFKGLLINENADILNTKYSKYFQIDEDITLFQWAFCRFFWESHINLPKIPMNILEEWETLLKD